MNDKIISQQLSSAKIQILKQYLIIIVHIKYSNYKQICNTIGEFKQCTNEKKYKNLLTPDINVTQ